MQNITIYAPATAPGKAGVAILRVSGPKAKEVVETLTRKSAPSPRVATFSSLYHPASNEKMDDALVLYFKSPSSFTGEDTAEFHLHGSRAVMALMLEALSKIQGLRPAEAGEFSRRAFENGKMDLTQLEGISDLIDAETAMQQKQAIRQMEGVLHDLYEEWRESLIETLAHAEAYIDFPDEDLPDDVKQKFIAQATGISEKIESHLKDRRGEVIRQGVFITILGAPNSGKSTLLNWLAKREVAIVSHIAGTTRDVIEVQMDLNGYPVTLCDTAGLRETTDAIESEGIRRALERSKNADLKLVLFDAATYPDNLDEATLKQIDGNTFILISKSDTGNNMGNVSIRGRDAFSVSAKSGKGMDAFINALTEKLDTLLSPDSSPVFTRERHRLHLRECDGHLKKFLEANTHSLPIELQAESLRQAAKSLGQITGRIDVEEILDAIFSKFCIGK